MPCSFINTVHVLKQKNLRSNLKNTLYHATMFQEDEAAKYARKGKGKMMEVDSEPSIPSPQPTSKQHSNIQRVLNAAAPMRPFSYSSFLPTSEPETSSFLPTSKPATIYFPSSFPPTTDQLIDQILSSHNLNMKNELYATVEKKAEELAAKKIHEKELQIHAKIIEGVNAQEKIKHYSGQIESLLGKEINWRKTVAHLQKRLQDANVARGDMWKEDTAESAHVDTGLVEPVRLDCMVCKKFVSTIMMWPCRHICICTTCNEVTNFCPVCNMLKITTIEVCIPTYD